MNKVKKVLSVGEVAKRAGVNVSAIHFYEKKGLISSSRNSGNQRRYNREVLRRISIIKAAQKVGISLENIKSAMASLPNNRTPTQKDWENLASSWQKELCDRIKYLQNLKKLMTGCIGCGCLSMKKCPLHNKDDKLKNKGEAPLLIEPTN